MNGIGDWVASIKEQHQIVTQVVAEFKGESAGHPFRGNQYSSGSTSGIFDDYDQMDAGDFSKKLSKMSNDIAPEVQFKPLEESNLTHTTSHGKVISWPSYDDKTDTVFGAEQGKMTASHEFSHALTRGSQTTDWVYSAEDIDGIGKALSENPQYHGEHYTLGKHEQREGGLSNPRNYNWQELGTELTADYIRGKLDSRLKPLLEDVANKVPDGRLKKLMDYKR